MSTSKLASGPGYLALSSTSSYENDGRPIWSDNGSALSGHVSIYRPKPATGQLILGDQAVKGLPAVHPAKALTLLVSEPDDDLPLVVPPSGFQCVWVNDVAGTGIASIWLPLAPDGYLPIGGVVATTKHTAPSIPTLCVIRADRCTKQVACGDQDLLWSAGGEKGIQLYRIPGLDTFYPVGGADVPPTVLIPDLIA
jgi:hypothetical protein